MLPKGYLPREREKEKEDRKITKDIQREDRKNPKAIVLPKGPSDSAYHRERKREEKTIYSYWT